MSTVPTNLTDSLNGLQADQDALGQAQTNLDAANSALTSAQSQLTTAQNALNDAVKKQQTDLTSFIGLVQTTYGTGAVPSPPPSPAPTPPSPTPSPTTPARRII